MSKQSFTLIEILVVVAIVGILSGFIFYTVQNNVSKANIAKSQVFSESIRNNLLLNLVSEWKLDNNANDAWGTNNGTMYNFPANPWKSSPDCISGSCLEFDGVDDYIDCGNGGNLTFNISDNFTISAWIKRNRQLREEFVVGKYDNANFGYALYFISGSNNNVSLYLRDSSYYKYFKSFTNIGTTDWYYIVGVWNGSIGKIYIDGVDDTGTTAGTIPLSLSAIPIFTIGTKANLTGFFNGSIDEVQIYNAALSSSQIKQNYLGGLNNLLSQGLISEEEYSGKLSDI